MQIQRFSRMQFQELLTVGREMHRESSYSHLKFSEEKLRGLGDRTIERPNEYLGLTAVEDGICGIFIGCIQPYFFSEEKIASDMILFVPQDRRGGVAAVRLIREYEHWAKMNGVKQIMLGVSTGVHEERTITLYKRLGYKMAGSIAKKNV